MYSRTITPCALAVLVAAPTAAEAAISISNAIIDVTPTSGSVHDIIVSNRGDSTEYVQVTLFRITAPGAKDPAAVAVSPRNTDLILSPRKMVVPAGGAKTLRIISRHTNLQEEIVYRAEVAPVASDEMERPQQMGVQVLVGYGVLILVRPQQMSPKVATERSGKTLLVRNVGNASVDVQQIRQCSFTPKGERSCEETLGERLYVGRESRYELPLDGPGEVHYEIAGESYAEAFK